MQKGHMKKILLLLVLTLTFSLIVVGCGQKTTQEIDKTDVATQNNKDNQSFGRHYELDLIIDLPPIKVGLVNASVITNTLYEEDSGNHRGHFALGLEIGNLSDASIWFFAEQAEIVLSTGEILKVDASISSDIGGNFPAHRLKKGFLLFPILETQPDTIEEFNLIIKAPLESDHETVIGDDVELLIDLK